MFFAKFQGFDDEVTLQFAKGFDGKVVRTGDLIMAVNKKTISRVTILFLEGEKQFKNKPIDKNLIVQFLKPKHHNVDWEKGVRHSWIKNEWHRILFILQKYLTFEGRYSIPFLYHIKLLLLFTSDPKINFPYFLLKSLQKMLKKVQKIPKNPHTIRYHYGLIKVLIEN